MKIPGNRKNDIEFRFAEEFWKRVYGSITHRTALKDPHPIHQLMNISTAIEHYLDMITPQERIKKLEEELRGLYEITR